MLEGYQQVRGAGPHLKGLTSIPLDVAARLFEASANIAEASGLLSPLFTGQGPPYEEALN